MRVTLHRTGGFAAIPGLEVRVGLDSAALPADDAAELETMVHQAQLDQFSSEPGDPVVDARPDGRSYVLGVEDADGYRSAQLFDPLPSQAVRDLVRLLFTRGSPLP